MNPCRHHAERPAAHLKITDGEEWLCAECYKEWRRQRRKTYLGRVGSRKHGLEHERAYIDGLAAGYCGKRTYSAKAHRERLQKYIDAHKDGGLEPWRAEAVEYAKKKLKELGG